MSTTLQTLESLTDTAIDSVKGYELAAEKAEDPILKRIFETQATRRRRSVETLNATLAELGGETRSEGTTTGDMHRIWMKITDAIMNSDAAAADNIEEGEDYIRRKFSDAINDNSITNNPTALFAVRKAYAEIREGEIISDQLESQIERLAA